MSDELSGMPATSTVRCDRCGLETSEPGLLKERRKSFSKKREWLCVSCQADTLKSAQRLNWVIYGICLFMGLLAALLAGDPDIFLYFAGLVAGIMTFSIVSVAIHEMGHAVVTLLMGWQLSGLILGTGRLLWEGRIGDVLLQFRFIQMGGRTLCAPKQDSAFLHFQGFLIFGAGPAANALAAWVGWKLYESAPHQFPVGIHWLDLYQIWIFLNVVNAFVNLIPFKTSVAEGALGSDGHQIMQTFIKPAEMRSRYLYSRAISHYVALRQFGELERAHAVIAQHLRDYPGDILGTQLMSAAECDLGNYEECAALSRNGLYWLEHGIEIHPAVAAGQPQIVRQIIVGAFQCNLAYAMLKGRLTDPAEALEIARKAYEKIPWLTAIQHTYGYALALNGQVAEGLHYLKIDKNKLREEPRHSRREIYAMLSEVKKLV